MLAGALCGNLLKRMENSKQNQKVGRDQGSQKCHDIRTG